MLGTDDSAHSERVYISDINPKNLPQEIRNGLQLINFRKIGDADLTIFIKPNLTDSTHNFDITTTHLMIKMIIEFGSQLVNRVIVGESPCGNCSFSADTSLTSHDVFDIAHNFAKVDEANLSKVSLTRCLNVFVERRCGLSFHLLLNNREY